MKSEVEKRASKKGVSGWRRLVPALAGLFVIALLLLNAPPAGAQGAAGDGYEPAAESAAASLETRAEQIEAELAKRHGDERLLANLTRTRVDAANALIAEGAGRSQSGVEELKRQLVQVRKDWSEYLNVAKGPGPRLAAAVAPALFQLAELSSNGREALANVKAAAAAEKIVTERRPNLNSWTTFALYELFAQNYGVADEALEEALSYAKTKHKREEIEGTFEKVERKARRFGKGLRHEEAASKQHSGA